MSGVGTRWGRQLRSSTEMEPLSGRDHATAAYDARSDDIAVMGVFRWFMWAVAVLCLAALTALRLAPVFFR